MVSLNLGMESGGSLSGLARVPSPQIGRVRVQLVECREIHSGASTWLGFQKEVEFVRASRDSARAPKL